MSYELVQTAATRATIPAAVILEALGHPVLQLDQDGVIKFANAAARSSLSEPIVDLVFADIFPEFLGKRSVPTQSGTVSRIAERNGRKFNAIFSSAKDGVTVVSLFSELVPLATAPMDLDDLTGLLKRSTLNERLEQTLSAFDGVHEGVAVHCLDLDRFKTVNDTLGHGVGDLLLKKVADRLRSACRKGDIVARVGGDEFVVLQASVAALSDAERLSARLVDLVSRTYVLSGHTINIGASVGLALATPKLCSRDLIRNADLALYEAKRAGRGRFRTFEPGMDAALRARRELEIDLRRALALKQFELAYQPFLDLGTDQVIGFEALIRWNHPTRGRVSPAEFIPLSEENGLITKIGDWVVRTACATAATWPNDLTVAVNVSPMQFKSDTLIETIVSALAHSKLAPNRLEIEITEGALLDNTESVLKTLHALRELGVKISMDDFGTGYSSLSYLQKFPFNKIKIDRSFVQGALESPDSEAILKAIVGLGSSLNMAITAEGVETSEQLSQIRNERCTHVQGFYTGRPMPAADILPFLCV